MIYESTDMATMTEKPWLTSYPAGVPQKILPDQYTSLCELLEESFESYAPRSAFRNMGYELTYQKLDEHSKAFAAFLQQEFKLQKGDRFGIMLPNCLQYPVALFGALRAGLVLVNINPLYTARELAHVIDDAELSGIIVLENFAHVLEQCQQEGHRVENVIVTRMGDFLGVKGHLVNGILKYVKRAIPRWSIPGAVRFPKTLRQVSASKYQKVHLENTDTAFLQYTGGTTGRAKGAILTHRNIISNVLQARAWVGNAVESHRDEGGIVTALPLYHIFSLTANCFAFSLMGVTNILISNPRDIPGFVKRLKQESFIAMTGVNTLFNALLNDPDFIRLDFSKFRFTLGGGMAVQRAVAERWKQVTGVTLLEAYGLTETSPAVCINPLTVTDFNGSIGLPIPSTEVAILDEHDKVCPTGEVGELCVKGPQVMKGYWRREPETQEALRNGWFHTGDVATMDADGYVRIVDRKKDMILVSGFNVYPNEVEDVLAMHTGVLEAAVIGVPDERCGEIVAAYIVARSDDLTKEALITHCRDQLTPYKVPKQVVFVKELPKTNVGKVLRRALRDEATVKAGTSS